MKKFIFLSLLLIGLVYTANGQRFVNGYVNDTIICSSAVDTVIVYIGGAKAATSGVKIAEWGSLEAWIETDSLTGSTGATAYMEYCYDGANTIWFPQETMLTINGATKQRDEWTDNNFTARSARIRVIAPSSSQTTRVRVAYAFKERRN